MNIYITILLEFLLISSSILLLFKFRNLLGLAPLYLFLGAVIYLQALSGTRISFTVLDAIIIYPLSVIIFSSLLFAVLLIYIKEGVSSARALVLGIVISNLLLSALFGIVYSQNLDAKESFFAFLINDKYFITGTILLLLDFLLLVIIYQYLISKISKRYFFFTLFISLLIVFVFDSVIFNITLYSGSADFKNLLLGNIIGKCIAALVFSFVLYIYLKYIGSTKSSILFIANQERDVFSILRYEKKYLKLKAEKQQLKENLTSQLEKSLNNISGGFISLDSNWCYIYVNKKAAELLGRSPESLIGKHIWTEFPEGVGRSFYNAYYKAVETQKTIYFDDYYEPLDKWFENRIYPSLEGLTIYYTDITEKKRAETNNQILRSLIETSDDFIGLASLASLEGKPIFLNANGRQLVGLEADETLPNFIADFYPKQYRNILVKNLLPNIYKNNKWNGETEFKNFKTGDLISIEMSRFLINDNNTNKPIALGIVATDITKRKEAEEKLINSEQLFKRLISKAPSGIYQTDTEGSCNYVNKKWTEYAGITYEDAMGYGWATAIHPDDKERILKEWEQYVLSGNSELETEFRFLHKNGHVIWVSVKTVGTYDAQNKLYGYTGMAIDTTDRKKAEEKLVKSEELFKRLASNAPVVVFQTDKDGACNYVNEKWMEYSGLTFKEALGYGWSNALHPEDRGRVVAEWKKGVSNGVGLISDFRFVNKKGEITWLSAKTNSLYDINNKLYGFVGMLVDINERKKTEEQIIKSEKYLNNIINNIGDPVFVKDDKSKLIIVNDAFCSIFNVERVDVIGKNLAKNVTPEERENFLSIDNHVIFTGIENVNQETLTLKGREPKMISTKKTRFIDENGTKYLIGTIRDITERKKANEEIRMAHQRLTTHLNNSPLAIIEWDKNLIIRNWSVQAKNIFGWEESEAIGKHFNDLNLVYEEDVDSTNIISNELMSGKVKANKIINRNYTKTNRIIYCEWYNSVLQSANGQIETVFSLVQDVSERTESEEKIKENEEKFSKVFQSNLIGFSIVNLNQVRVDVNNAMAKLVESTKEHLIGKTLEEAEVYILDEAYYEQKNTLTEKIKKNGFLSNETINRTLKSGKLLITLVSVAPIEISGVTHYLSATIDITDKKIAEEELEKYKNQLEELVKIRTEEVDLKNSELQRMNKLFVGRELRMKELKNIIKEMQSKNDN